MTEIKFTFIFSHPSDTDLRLILVKNTVRERQKTGRKYWLKWYMYWDYENNLTIARREFTERALVKDYYEIIEMVDIKWKQVSNSELNETFEQLLKELKQFEPCVW